MTLNPPWAASSEKLEYGLEALAHEQTVPNIEVRIGAIYALERIAKHNLDEHIQIMEILCAYVRENAPIKKQTRSSKPRSDVQTALTVIGRRTEKQIQIECLPINWPKGNACKAIRYLSAGNNKVVEFSEALLLQFKLEVRWQAAPTKFFIDLNSCELAGVNLRRGNFANTNFSNCNLQSAKFLAANLQNCDFSNANLKTAELDLAELSGSNFWFTNLCAAGLEQAEAHGVEFWGTKFDKESDLSDATFYLASFRDVDLSSVKISNYQIEAAFADNLTKVSKDTNKPTHWGCTKHERLEFIVEMKDWATDPLNYEGYT